MNCLNQDSQDDERAYLKRARRNRGREVVSTGKEVSDDKRLLILEILLQTTENAGGHTNPPTTNVARGPGNHESPRVSPANVYKWKLRSPSMLRMGH